MFALGERGWRGSKRGMRPFRQMVVGKCNDTVIAQSNLVLFFFVFWVRIWRSVVSEGGPEKKPTKKKKNK